MKKEKKLKLLPFLCLTLSILLAGCSVKNQDSIIQDGNIIYTYEGGTIQCISQKGPYGTIAVLVQSLKENTFITDVELGFSGDVPVIKLLMAVRNNHSVCAGTIDTQEVFIPLQPVDVPEITLEGRPIIAHNGMVVLTPFNAKQGFDQIFEDFDRK